MIGKVAGNQKQVLRESVYGEARVVHSVPINEFPCHLFSTPRGKVKYL